MRTASFYTLGCRLNQTESALLGHALKKKGYLITTKKENADLCVINSCTVTGMSDSKCRQTIRQVQKKNPTAIVAVIGCYSQMASDEILEIGGVHLILGSQDKMKLVEYLDQVELDGAPVVSVGAIDKQSFQLGFEGQHRGLTRANLKIQDGCDFVCSFCIIPQARGRSRSRLQEDCLLEAKALAEADVKELVLTGVNLGCYSEGKHNFLTLIQSLESILQIKRVRISSIEPTTVGSEVFALMADAQRQLVPYLHLPLQSGSDKILKLMRRKYNSYDYLQYLDQALEAVPALGIGTDVIVGFPGESDADFQDTYRLLQQSPVHYFHVFPFATRQGTTAANLTEQVPAGLIQERALALRELSDQKRTQFAAHAKGEIQEVLFEHNNGGARWQGYTGHYLRVEVESKEALGNQLRLVQISGNEGSLATGVVLNSVQSAS